MYGQLFDWAGYYPVSGMSRLSFSDGPERPLPACGFFGNTVRDAEPEALPAPSGRTAPSPSKNRAGVSSARFPFYRLIPLFR